MKALLGIIKQFVDTGLSNQIPRKFVLGEVLPVLFGSLPVGKKYYRLSRDVVVA